MGRSGATSLCWAPWRRQDVPMSARYQMRLISASRAQAGLSRSLGNCAESAKPAWRPFGATTKIARPLPLHGDPSCPKGRMLRLSLAGARKERAREDHLPVTSRRCDRFFSGVPIKINPVPAVQPSVVRSRRRLVTSRARTTFPFVSNSGCAAVRWSRSRGVLPSIFSTSAATR